MQPLIITLLILLTGWAGAASWYSCPQVWGKDETHPLNVNLSRARQENLWVAGNIWPLFESPTDPSPLRSTAAGAHSAGLKIIGQVWNTILSKDNPDAAALTAAGVEAIKYNGQKFADWYITTCPNQPAWRNYQKEVVRGIASAEVDGFGTIYGDWLVERCFCSSCEAYFRAYLKSHYTSSQLLTWGIPDIDAFDYSDYLSARGITQAQIVDDSDKSAIPLLEDYYKMKDQLAAEYLNELAGTARAYGKSDLIIMNGAEGCSAAKYIRLPTLEVLSYYADFDPLNLIFSYKENSPAIYYKILKSMRPNSGLVVGLIDESAGGIINGAGNPEKYIYGLMAEALANRALFYDQDRIGLWNGQALNWSTAPSLNLKVETFLQRYYPAFDLDKLQSCAKIGILYSAKSQLKCDRLYPNLGEKSIAGIGKALSKTGHQYDVIFNGDGELMPETIAPGILSRYELIIIPEMISLTDNEKSSLLSYVNAGGKLLAYANLDGSFPLTPGEATYGSGKIYYETNPLPRYYNGTASRTYLNTIEAQVDHYLSSKLVSGISQTSILAQVWKTSDPERVYLHLINHDFDNTITNLLITMEVPANFWPDKLYLASPDLAEQPLIYIKNTQTITFTVPELDVWDLLILTSTQEAQQSAERTSIIKSLAAGPNPASTSSSIFYSLSESATVKISIYSITGELIKIMLDAYTLGNIQRSLNWDLKDALGSSAANGVYIYTFEARGSSGRISRGKGKIIILR